MIPTTEFSREIDKIVKAEKPDANGRYRTLDTIIADHAKRQSVRSSQPARFYGRDNSATHSDRDATANRDA